MVVCGLPVHLGGDLPLTFGLLLADPISSPPLSLAQGVPMPPKSLFPVRVYIRTAPAGPLPTANTPQPRPCGNQLRSAPAIIYRGANINVIEGRTGHRHSHHSAGSESLSPISSTQTELILGALSGLVPDTVSSRSSASALPPFLLSSVRSTALSSKFNPKAKSSYVINAS